MPQLRILTAGESHGVALIGIIDGIPSGLSLIATRDIDPILAKRQIGYGRSYRQSIESDKAEILSGVRFGITTGAPIAIKIENKDWKNWSQKMSVLPIDDEIERVTIPRPGHSDLAGGVKYDSADDLRNVFERASARETAMRVAIGAIVSKLLNEIGITSISFTKSIGTVESILNDRSNSIIELRKIIDSSNLRMYDSNAAAKAITLIDDAKRSGDTLGGVVQAEFYDLPVGIGSHVQWDRKLDSELARTVMSIQAVKGVEIGDGFELASCFGSSAHDEININDKRLTRSSNHAGGIEGGMSNGMPIVLRAAMKPISTLMKPLRSVDLKTGESASAHIERSDVCAVPALSVIVEQVVATALGSAILDTFGSDTMDELKERIKSRRKQEQSTK